MKFLSLMMLLVAPSDAKVSMLDGQSHNGALSAISTTEIVMAENRADIKVPISDVMAIEFPAVTVAASQEPQLLVLRDGSQLHGSAVARTARQLSMQADGLGKLDIEADAVESVRLLADNPAFREQWNTFLKRDSDRDLLIVAKRDGSGLDFLAGVVSSISSEKTEFLLDGDTIPVPASRVYGIVFAKVATGAESAKSPRPGAVVTSSAGNTIAARSITLDGGSLKIECGWGQVFSVALDQIQKIDLSSNRIQFLSDLVSLEERFDGVDPEGSLLAGLIDEEQQKLLFGPRRDTTIQRQAKLRLRGREFSKGLCIHSRTEMSWALDGRFSTFESLVGVDDEVAFNGSHAVSLKISGDGAALFEKLIGSAEEPIPVRVPLEGVSTLTVLVDFGDGDSVCDWLDLADAKLVIKKDVP